MITIKHNLHDNIREYMIKSNINQKQLAKICGVSEVTISRYVRGERLPNSDILSRLATALSTTTDNLLSRSTNKESNYIQVYSLINKKKDKLTNEEKYELIKLITSAE